MKRSYLVVLLTLVFLVIGAAPASAQSEARVVFHTAFGFTAGASSLPAGTYTISTDEGGRAFIAGVKSSHAGVLLVRGGNPGPAGVHAAVNFIAHNGRYYLNTVTLPDGRTMQFNTPLPSRHQLLQ